MTAAVGATVQNESGGRACEFCSFIRAFLASRAAVSKTRAGVAGSHLELGKSTENSWKSRWLTSS